MARQNNSLRGHQSRLTRAMLLALLLVTPLLIILNLIIVGPDSLSLQGILSLLGLIGVVAVALARLSRGHLEQAAILVIGSLLLLLAYEVAEGGIRSSAEILPAFTLPIAFAGLLLGRAALLVTLGITLLTVLGVRALEATGSSLVAFDPGPVEPGSTVIIFVLVMGLLALILDRFGGALHIAYLDARERERELTEVNTMLQRQVRETKEAQTARDRSEDRLRLASEAAGLGVWTWDIRSNSVTWSDSLRDLLGLNRDTPASVETFMERVHPDDRAGLDADFGGWTEKEMVDSREFRILRPDGRTLWIESRYRVFLDREGNVEQLSGVLTDVSERKNLEEDLERRVSQRTKELNLVNGELEAFTYSASHDLRAPLRGIHGFAQVLLEDYQDKLDEAGLEHLNRIRLAASKMGGLIDGLLELASVTKGRPARQRVDLSELARELALELQEDHPERATEIEIEPAMVAYGDKRWLELVLSNLIGNAWKFTAQAEHPRIEIGSERQGEEQVFFVRDNGAGFDMKYASKLFVPFQRLHASAYEGSGIGLATVQRVINRLGGRIWADSKPGEGATFYFTLESPD